MILRTCERMVASTISQPRFRTFLHSLVASHGETSRIKSSLSEWLMLDLNFLFHRTRPATTCAVKNFVTDWLFDGSRFIPNKSQYDFQDCFLSKNCESF